MYLHRMFTIIIILVVHRFSNSVEIVDVEEAKR